MSSLPFSIGSCTPNTLVTYSTTPILKNPAKASRIRIPNQEQEINPHQIHDKNSSTLLFRRREAVGFSFCFGLFDVLSQPKYADAAAASICELTVAPSGLAFCDKVLGTGPEAVKGKLIKAHYVGKLEDGTVFDSSYNRGSPLTFRIGVGEVIKGWDQGILGSDGVPPMLAGGKRTLKLPPELGYGVRGAGCRGGSCLIPPNAVLLFDVEFIG